MRGGLKTGKWKNVVLGKMKVLVLQYLQWYSENSGIGSRLLDTRYDFKYLNSSMNMSHRNCTVEIDPFHLNKWFSNLPVKLFT